MRVSLATLREIADLPEDPAAITRAMDALGMAVESVEHVAGAVPSVVTARVVRCERHPDAAKVTRVWVDAGDGVERHVWCGATNMGPGDVVPLALPGAELPDGRVIARRAILGIDSDGMLCAPGEIGLPGDDAGLLILPVDAPLGVSPHDILGLQADTIFDLDLTRNRPDCWGHLGVARDLAAHFGADLRGVAVLPAPEGTPVPVSVTIEDPECGMFAAVVVSGVTVGPSPQWVASRLAALGMRSINNVVDASNLVMLECNQPNHAYDRRDVSDVIVRRASPGETLTTLDGLTRTLDPADLLICDGAGVPVGLAGVMGGENSEVDESTVEVLLEVAWFEPDSVRFTAQRHGLRTEASARFERGVDPEGARDAINRFVTILRETCPEIRVRGPVTETRRETCPVAARVELRGRTIERLLGRGLADDDLRRLLHPIGFDVVGAADGDAWTVGVPTWRPDCTEEVDIIEEIARHLGYDSLGRRPLRTSQAGRLSVFQQRRRTVRATLLGLGLDEVMPSPFLAPGDLDRCGLDEGHALRLANPLAAEESILRTSVRPGMLAAAARNVSHRVGRVRLWEMGHVYPSSPQPLPAEFEQLGVLVVGADLDVALDQWLTLADALGVGAQIDQRRRPPGLHPGRSASLSRGKTIVGAVGEIDPAVTEVFGIRERVAWLELDMTVLLGETPKIVRAKPVSRLPSADIDLSFAVGADVAAVDVHRALRQAAGALAAEVVLFDVWADPAGGRSLTFRLRLQPHDRTLTDDAIATVRDACIAGATKAGAHLRGSLE